MLHVSQLDVEFFAHLMERDAQIAREVAAGGCPHCGGPLHQGNFDRKPRGGLVAGAGEAFTLRFSLCCGREGCRKRSTPPSLRFLGRRVYLEAVVLLAAVAAQVTSALGEARAMTGVPGRTMRRWGTWWRGTFPESRTWRELRGRFVPPPPAAEHLPRSLVERLVADGRSTLREVCSLAARLLAPATTATVADASRFARGTEPCPKAG